jgi:hypothetical protein
MISSKATFERFNKIPDQDFEDLYEGGKVSANLKFKGSFADYDSQSDGSGDYGGFQTASSLAKKQERDFIQKQFDLRKAAAAEKMEDFPKTSISRVKFPMSTETKVKGLTIKTREANLDHLVDTLKAHMDKINEKTDHNLKRKDLEDIAKEMEYEIFAQCQAVSVYRMKFAKHIHSIKTSSELHPALKSHVPVQRQSFGGDYKTYEKEIRSKYGDDVVNEIEKEKNEKSIKVEKKRKDKFQQSGRDGFKQEKINSFFTKNEKKSETQSRARESSVEIIEVKQEIIEVFDDVQEANEADKIKIEKENVETEDSEQSFSLDQKIEKLKILGMEENNKNSPFYTDFKQEVKVEESKKRKLDQDDDYKKSPKRARESISSSHRLRDKNEISAVVVKELTFFYRKDLFKSDDPKKLFKDTARNLTHHFKENPSKKSEIRSQIAKIFRRKGHIKEVDDVILNKT